MGEEEQEEEQEEEEEEDEEEEEEEEEECSQVRNEKNRRRLFSLANRPSREGALGIEAAAYNDSMESVMISLLLFLS